MEEKLDLKKASSYYLVGTLFNKGIGFITVPVFTRLLSVADYGIVTTYNSWVSIVSIFMSLALYMAIRSAFIDYEGTVNDFLAVILTFTCLYGGCLSAVVLVLAGIIHASLNTGLILLCLLQAMASALIEDVSMYLMMKYRFRARTILLVLPNLVSTVIAFFVIKFVFSEHIYLGRIIPNALITFLFGIIVLIFGYKESKARINREYISYGLKISLPLVLHGLALGILSQSDRTMITAIRNASETGIYGLVYNFSMIATVLTTAFDGIWIPYFTRQMNAGKYKEINHFSVKYIELMTMAITGVVLVGPEVVKILATRAYWEGIKIIPPIVLSNFFIFIYTMYVNVEHYYKKTVFISINTIIAAVVNIILNVFMINKWGYTGAAYATLISYVLAMVMHIVYSKRLNHELFPVRQFIIPLTMIGAAIIVFHFFVDVWFIRWAIAAVYAAIVLIHEKNWIFMNKTGM